MYIFFIGSLLLRQLPACRCRDPPLHRGSSLRCPSRRWDWPDHRGTSWPLRTSESGVRRPFWRPPSLLSPLRESPSRRPARVQYRSNTSDQAVQSTSRWESSSDDEAIPPNRKETRGTQEEAPIDLDIQKKSPERSYTPSGTPPKLRRWGPRRHTVTTRPSIEWLERL